MSMGLKIKVTVHTEVCAQALVKHVRVQSITWISKLFGINNHHDKTICRLQELYVCCLLEGQGHTKLQTLSIDYSENFSYPAHYFVLCIV